MIVAGSGAMVVAGIGCRRLCAAEEIAALVRRAEAISGRRADLLATPEFKRDEPGIAQAATLLGLKLALIGSAALLVAEGRCVTPAPAALRHVGVAAVAEAAALAAAGPDARLVLPRIATARATCALAERAA